jgi:hypothetical protein
MKAEDIVPNENGVGRDGTHGITFFDDVIIN